MSLTDIYNRLFEPAPSLDDTYVPSDEDLAEIKDDFKGWVPPSAADLGDDNKVKV